MGVSAITPQLSSVQRPDTKRAVVQKVVLLHRPVAGGFDHERRVDPRSRQLHPLVDDVLVAALVPQVLLGTSDTKGGGVSEATR